MPARMSGADRVRIIANGNTWTKATSATQMANASTAELTATTGYSLKTAAGLRPTCSEFNTILHRGCPSGQFLFYAYSDPSHFKTASAHDAGIHRTPVVRSLVPSDLITTGIAVVSTCNNIGLIILQNLGGILVEKTSLPVFYRIMACIVAGIMLLACFLRTKDNGLVFG